MLGVRSVPRSRTADEPVGLRGTSVLSPARARPRESSPSSGLMTQQDSPLSIRITREGHWACSVSHCSAERAWFHRFTSQLSFRTLADRSGRHAAAGLFWASTSGEPLKEVMPSIHSPQQRLMANS